MVHETKICNTLYKIKNLKNKKKRENFNGILCGDFHFFTQVNCPTKKKI